jgi:hypothetical protein
VDVKAACNEELQVCFIFHQIGNNENKTGYAERAVENWTRQILKASDDGV